MKTENMLQRFSCTSFLFKPPCFDVLKILGVAIFYKSSRWLLPVLIFKYMEGKNLEEYDKFHFKFCRPEAVLKICLKY